MAFRRTKWVQLATRIPGDLRRTAKLHAVGRDMTLQTFVIAALEEKLEREGALPARSAGEPAADPPVPTRAASRAAEEPAASA